MRNALATVGHMAFAIAIATVVSVISLIAIARVQWPAYPSSNQLHALTTVGQVGCIVGLLAAGWLWRRGRRLLARWSRSGCHWAPPSSTCSASLSTSSSAPNT
jgi:galactan 5-O-arabinofuranosyltransferase